MFKKVFILLSLTSCFLVYGQSLGNDFPFEDANTDEERLIAYKTFIGDYTFEMHMDVFGEEIFISLIEQAQLQDPEALYKLGLLVERTGSLENLNLAVLLHERAIEIIRGSGLSGQRDLFEKLTTKIYELKNESIPDVEAYSQ